MPKKILIVLCMLCLACPALPAQAAPSAFTLMIYLCGTDLETDDGSCSDDILEMIEAELSADGPITVLLETGGTRAWQLSGMNAGENQRWLVGDGGLTPQGAFPRRDMADAQTLADFISWGAAAYPADRYGLILWNHGGGSARGVCTDEFSGNYLTTQDIHAALSDVQRTHGDFRLDLVAFDACLMATYEMASHLAPFADYMVASEEVVPGYGFDYTGFLRALSRDPSMDTLSLARQVIDTCMDTTLAYDPDDYLTFSVLDLRQMDALIAALEDIGEGLAIALETGGLQTISRRRHMMRSFGEYAADGSDMVDMRHFIQTYADIAGADAGRALRALDAVVVYNEYTRDKLDNISGLSVLMPLLTASDFDEYSWYYDPLSLYPRYSSFLHAYTKALNEGSHAFSTAFVRQSTGLAAAFLEDAYEAAEHDAASESAQSGQGFVPVPREDAPAAGFVEIPSTGSETYDEDAALADADIFTYTLTLSPDDLAHLAYVEGNLMIDISDDDMEAYIDLGYLRNNEVDWETGVVTSRFDGTWPMLAGQLVHMTDQIVTERTRRSLIDARVNDLDGYLLVVFDEQRPGGEVIGYTEGYGENGMPARGYTKLSPGDVIVPQYYLYYYDEDGEEYTEMFDGDPIVYTGEALSFGYESMIGSDTDFAYTFCLNDIFGDYAFTDFVYFSL